MKDSLKTSLQSFLEIQPPMIRSYHLLGEMDFAGNAIKNRLWYRGQAEELEQFWKQVPGVSTRHRFWAVAPNVGREIEKIHVGIPALVVDMLTDIVVTDLQQVDAGDGVTAEAWEEIAEENDFSHLVAEACREALVIGDGAFRISLDSAISDLPIVEFIPGDRCEFEHERGRLTKVRFKTGMGDYDLVEEYGIGYIQNWAEKGGKTVALEDAGLDIEERIEWDEQYMMAVPLKFFPSALFKGRGGSVFDSRSENFDALDEAWSQWMDALRKARTKEYIPDSLIPRDKKNGSLMMPSAFDNAFIKVEDSMGEGSSNRIEVVQPDIKHDSYLQTYVNALDLCLMGLVSPSTLGIDVKKLDNAEAQREKEKATLYTRNKMVDVLQNTLPKLVQTCVNVWQTANGMAATRMDVSIEFGEYANPSFESMVETVGKAKVQGIMSVEACVEELYGDTRDDEWKAQEVDRLKLEQGISSVTSPQVGITWEELRASQG